MARGGREAAPRRDLGTGGAEVRILVAAALRHFGLGLVSVEVALAWRHAGLSAAAIGGLFTLALAAGGASSALAGPWAARVGRRRLLMTLAALMAGGGVVLALGRPLWLLVLPAAAATFSPSGKDVGGMLPLEQAALAELAPAGRRTALYARYNLLASWAGALGALAAGGLPLLARDGLGLAGAERLATGVYAAVGLALVGLYRTLPEAVEGAGGPRDRARHGRLGPSRTVVLRLTALFGVDALAGGLVVQGILALWFHQRFGVGLGLLGPLFFLTNLAAGLSLLAAAPLARRFGLLQTMVYTHLPSNGLLLLVALAPSFPLAAALLVARSLLSQLDVPTRQAYTMQLVQPEERGAAAGVTASVRGFSQAAAPALTGWAMASAATALPLLLAGGLKAAYDIALYAVFRRVPLPDAGRG
jgi:MFS family permease